MEQAPPYPIQAPPYPNPIHCRHTFGAMNAGPGQGAGGGDLQRVVLTRGAAPVQCVEAATSAGIAFLRQQRSGSAVPPSGVQSKHRTSGGLGQTKDTGLIRITHTSMYSSPGRRGSSFRTR